MFTSQLFYLYVTLFFRKTFLFPITLTFSESCKKYTYCCNALLMKYLTWFFFLKCFYFGTNTSHSVFFPKCGAAQYIFTESYPLKISINIVYCNVIVYYWHSSESILQRTSSFDYLTISYSHHKNWNCPSNSKTVARTKETITLNNNLYKNVRTLNEKNSYGIWKLFECRYYMYIAYGGKHKINIHEIMHYLKTENRWLLKISFHFWVIFLERVFDILLHFSLLKNCK